MHRRLKAPYEREGAASTLGLTKMADDNRPEAKLPQALEKDFLTEK